MEAGQVWVIACPCGEYWVTLVRQLPWAPLYKNVMCTFIL